MTEDENDDFDRSSVWLGAENWFTFIDYDGESLQVCRRGYGKTQFANEGWPDYIALNYEGQGPVVMDVAEARRFIRQWSDLLDKMEGQE